MSRRALLLAMFVVVTACGGGKAATTTTTSTTASTTTASTAATTAGTTASTFTPTIQWTACAAYQCGTMAVPIDWAQPDGKTITIALIRSPAKNKSERIGSLLVNPGGPGGSGIELVKEGFEFDQAVADHFDLIGWDPRGVGESSRLACGAAVPAFHAADAGPDTPAEQADLDQKAKAVADECGAKDADLLRHMATDDVVRDMDGIRRALGEATISYYGFSYGTYLGERYAEMFPHGARAIGLDGVVDPTQDLAGYLRGQAAAMDGAASKVFAACDTERSCPVKGGEAAAYDHVAAEVEQHRIPAGSHTLGPTELATGAIYVLYDQSLWPEFNSALAKAEAGDGSAMYGLFEGYESFGDFTSYVAVECLDSAHPEGAAAYEQFASGLRALSPRFGEAVANELLPCAFWPVPPTGSAGPVSGVGAPPELVIGNTGDPVTPYDQAVAVSKMLQGAVLLTYDGEGHASYGKSSCVDNIVDSYLVDLKLPAPGTTCH